MKFWDDFKKFAFKGNVVDMAVGVIIGGAFGTIVKSLVDDVLMPCMGMLTGGADFTGFKIQLGPENFLNYGNFITAIINFLITALVIFILLKVINGLTERLSALTGEEEEKPAPTTKKCPYCCSEIDIKATRCPHCTSVLEEE